MLASTMTWSNAPIDGSVTATESPIVVLTSTGRAATPSSRSSAISSTVLALQSP